MAYADAPTHPTIGAQVRVFEEAVAIARAAGLTDAAAGTWPTPRRRSRCPTPGTTSSARASPSTGSTRSAATRPTTACARR